MIRKHKLDCQCCSCKQKRGEYRGKNSPRYIDGRSLIKNYCIDCDKEISWNAKRCIFCARAGVKHPRYVDGKTSKKYYCKYCGKEINWQTGTKGKGGCRNCSQKRKKDYITKRSNVERHIIHYCKEPNCNNQIIYKTWKNGSGKCRKCSAKGRNKGIERSKKTRSLISLARGGTGTPYENSEYPEIFFKKRTKIRKRDNYTCQNEDCNKTFNKYSRKLQVHHIDFNKQNNDESNLISLCDKCNIRANFNREYWESYYTKRIKSFI